MRGDRPWLNRLHSPTLQLVSGRVELRKAGLGRSVQLEEPCVKNLRSDASAKEQRSAHSDPGTIRQHPKPRVLHSPIDSLYSGHLTGLICFYYRLLNCQ